MLAVVPIARQTCASTNQLLKARLFKPFKRASASGTHAVISLHDIPADQYRCIDTRTQLRLYTMLHCN